jgi:hypothetical protein
MASRVLAVIVSLLIVLVSFLLLGYGLLFSGAALWEIVLILLLVNTVTVFILWKMIGRFYRYAIRPFQIKQNFELRFSDDEEPLGRILVEGPAQLILMTIGPLAIFTLRDIQPSCASVRYPHGSKEVEFVINHRAQWSAVLTARKAGWNMAKNGELSTLTLEVRGHCRVHQLPEAPQVQAKGFPVVMPRPDEASPHHL